MPRLQYVLCVGLFCSVNVITAMVVDNRFFPLLPHTVSRTANKMSNAYVDIFAVTAHEAYINSDDSGGIPEIFGIYNQNQVAQAIVLLGKPNPLATDFPNLQGPIPWHMHGRIRGEGISFAYYQSLWASKKNHANLSMGFSWFFMHTFSHIGFRLSQETIATLELSADDIIKLDQIRRFMNEETGIEAPKATQAGISDIDFYLRWGGLWDYFLKFRHIDAGLRCGLLINSGVTREIDNPASLPYGGNGLFGIYFQGDLEFEIKEDWKVGGYARFSQRFGKRQKQRIPLNGEQSLFGVTVGKIDVHQGPTFAASGYFSMEDIRDGLGVQVNYTVISHFDDLWEDARKIKSPMATLERINRQNSWNSEYVTLNVFYDFAKVRGDNCYAPSFWFMWDVPVKFAIAKRVSRTNRISFGMVLNF